MAETTAEYPLVDNTPADRRQSRPGRTASSRINPAQAESNLQSPQSARLRSPKFQRRRPPAKIEEIEWKNLKSLRYFLADDGSIRSQRKTGASAKMQRRVVRAIKQARYLALLPYTNAHVYESGDRLPRELPDLRRPNESGQR